MHWVIQNNIHRESGYDEFITALDRNNISYDLVKVVPFSHELIPDVNPPNPVIGIGSYTMEQISKRKGWKPGLFTNENFTYEIWSERYKGYILNDDAIVVSFGDSIHLYKEDMEKVKFHYDLFIRPCKDGKEFAGMINTWEWFQNWAKKVLDLNDDYYKTITKDTMIMVAGVKPIQSEYRFFVVDGKVITGSQYKQGNRVIYSECIDENIIKFTQKMVNIWQPDIAFVLDIAMVKEGLKIIEINCMNGSGFYACNMAKVVDAIEQLN